MSKNTLQLQKLAKKQKNLLDLQLDPQVRNRNAEPLYISQKSSKAQTQIAHSTLVHTRTTPPAQSKLFHQSPLTVSLMRSVAVFLIVMLNWVTVSHVGSTISYYNDVDYVRADVEAGLVDFTLSLTPFASLAIDGQSGSSIFVLPESLSNPFRYFASSTLFSGDLDFCASLTAHAFNGETLMYEGPLMELSTDITEAIDEWKLIVTAGQPFANAECSFALDFNGWQTRHDHPTFKAGGYTDTERVTQTVLSPGIRINKILPVGYIDGGSGDVTVVSVVENEGGTNEITIVDECCEESDTDCVHDEGDVTIVNTNNETSDTTVTIYAESGTVTGTTYTPAEWVELYNQTGATVSIEDWLLCDNTSCVQLDGVPDIAPYGFLVIAESIDDLAHAYLPPTLPVHILGTTIGDGLGDSADMLELRKPSGVAVDAMNYGDPDHTWPNYVPSVWTPGVIAPGPHEALSRIPTSKDTDTPDDWGIRSLPTIDLIYPDENGSYIWYWFTDYTILWDASMATGVSEDLLITLTKVFDTDGDLTLDPDDTHEVIAENIPNTGSYVHTLPGGTVGYLWIVVTAIHPDNPLLSAHTASGLIFDPVPPDMWEENPDLVVEMVVSGADYPEEPEPQPATDTLADTPDAPQDVADTSDDTDADTITAPDETNATPEETPSETTVDSTEPTSEEESGTASTDESADPDTTSATDEAPADTGDEDISSETDDHLAPTTDDESPADDTAPTNTQAESLPAEEEIESAETIETQAVTESEQEGQSEPDHTPDIPAVPDTPDFPSTQDIPDTTEPLPPVPDPVETPEEPTINPADTEPTEPIGPTEELAGRDEETPAEAVTETYEEGA